MIREATELEATMQYVLLIYQGTTPLPTNPDAWATLSEEEQKAIYQDYGALNKTSGVSPGLTLGLPQDATTVQVKDGKTVTREGPYLSEGAGGYLVFEADDLDAAIELASRIPAARLGGAIEIRPVATHW
ncbi:MAG TPA: YciI family protein [Acidimicrobiales bacterium]|nr:YciI family protein [Acidimicrobiales bacterium]